MDKVSIPLALLDKSVSGELIIVYSWLTKLIEGQEFYQVDFREVSTLTGIAIPKLSRLIKTLENLSLIGVNRDKKVVISLSDEMINETYLHKLYNKFQKIANKHHLKKLVDTM